MAIWVANGKAPLLERGEEQTWDGAIQVVVRIGGLLLPFGQERVGQTILQEVFGCALRLT